MGPKKQRTRKNKNRKFKKNNRNIYDPKSSPSELVFVENLPCSSDSSTENFEYDISSKVSKKDSLKFFLFDSLSQDRTDSSKSVFNTKKELESLSDDIVDMFQTASKHNELSCLNDVISDCLHQNNADLSDPTPHIVIGRLTIPSVDELAACIDNRIYFLCTDFTDSSESIYLFLVPDLESPICGTNDSSVSLNDSKLLTGKPTDTKMFSLFLSTDSNVFSLVKASFKVRVLNAYSCICTKFHEILLYHNLRNKKLQESFNQENKWRHSIDSKLETLMTEITSKTISQYFIKFKRNACIQSLYFKKMIDIKQCIQNILYQKIDILRLLHENCGIHWRKMIRGTDKGEWDDDIWNELGMKEMEEAMENFRLMDIHKYRQMSEKVSILDTCMKKLEVLTDMY